MLAWVEPVIKQVKMCQFGSTHTLMEEFSNITYSKTALDTSDVD